MIKEVINKPKVSVIVVNWNGGEYLKRCIDSLNSQTFRDFEVIVIDNGSIDGSAIRLKGHYNGFVNLIRNQRNMGFCGGNNTGIRHAKGELIALLNMDAVAEPDWLERLVQSAEMNPQAGMWASKVVLNSNSFRFDSAGGLMFYPDGVCRNRGWQESDIGQYDREEETLAPHGCAAMYRRQMLEDIGLLDENYFAYLEDLDLGLRGQFGGWKCIYVPKAVVHHERSIALGNHSKTKAFLVERNRIWNMIKFMPLFLLIISPLFTINRYLLQGYAAATHQGISGRFGRDYSKLQMAWILIRAYGSALLKLPEMLAERKRIQKRRKISVREIYLLISRYKLDAIEIALKD